MLLIFGTIIGLFLVVVEIFLPRQSWPLLDSWWLRALILNLIQLVVAVLTGYLIDSYFSQFSLMHLPYSTYVQVLIGYLAITFIYYWWHRLRHTRLFWNLFHQLHHSATRLEVITAFYKHPLEIGANGILSSSILYLLLGLNLEAGAIVVFITGIAELFYHWNIKTPYWLGFLFQRPESHCIHHQRGKHHYNYSDLPIWDMLFGTFYNPKDSEFECGFGDQKELRVVEMLLFKNVNGAK